MDASKDRLVQGRCCVCMCVNEFTFICGRGCVRYYVVQREIDLHVHVWCRFMCKRGNVNCFKSCGSLRTYNPLVCPDRFHFVSLGANVVNGDFGTCRAASGWGKLGMPSMCECKFN